MLDELEYFGAVLSEVLRLYPPAGMITRFNRKTETFCGYEVPPNTRMVVSPHMVHRHPKYWDEPETFRPERWIHKTEAERQAFQERTRYAYIPFSAGGRNCIGQKFAQMEAKLILAPLIREFEFFIAPSQRATKHTFTSFVTTKLKPELKISLKMRDIN